MQPLWNRDTRIVSQECCMFAGTRSAGLLFPATEILRAACPTTGRVFLEGKDFRHAPGSASIELTEHSAIATLSDADLHPAEPECRLYPAPDANAVPGGVDGRALLFDHKDFFARHQVEFDYRSTAIDFPAPIQSGAERLPRFRARLARPGDAVRVTLIGDSISEGFNATEFIGSPPFAPAYPEQVRRALEERFGVSVELLNRAIGGTGCRQAADIAGLWLADRPDLLVIAYGMNDFSSLRPEEFIGVLQEIIDRCRAVSPETEYLLVAPMSGNPDWQPTRPGPDAAFAAALRNFVAAAPVGIAAADVHCTWSRFLERKRFFDLTGNGVNHPNDYGHRIYASVLMSLLDPQKNYF